ncbi:hypothetical protein KAT80_00985 [Candidatus Pacearchaeota archaeon]|nr:hypothetical protein [Candidatus Pacearchaeota archaeon]
MKHFIYFSKDAVTSGKALSQNSLMRAGRMDIAIHSLIQGLFLSHDFRTDVKFHFVFYGMPDPPKHIEIQVKENTVIRKKDVGTLIKKILYKYKEGEKHEVFPGCFVEKKSFLKVVEELAPKGVPSVRGNINTEGIFILDKKGEDIRKAEIPKDCVFILGDQEGLPKKELKRLKKIAISVSVGGKVYFASQVVVIVNNELDYRGV